MKINTYINQAYAKSEIEINYKNSTADPIEIIFEIPLRPEIIFDHFIAKIKDKKIKSKVIESNKSEEKYSDAIAKGNTGITSTYNLEDKICSIKIGNIPPQETLELKCYFVQFLTIQNSFFNLNLIKEFPKIEGFNYYYNEIECKIVIENFSLMNLLKENEIKKSLQNNMNEKQIIEYKYNEFDKILFKTSNMTKPILIRQYNSKLDETNYILNYYYENKSKYYNSFKNNKYPCLFIIIIDQSGSMDDIIKNVSKILKDLIQSFPKNSYYQLIGFGSNCKIYNLKPEINSEENLKKSLEIINTLSADLGGTDLSLPLNHILKNAYSDYKDIYLSKQIIVLTDGDINIGEDIIELINLHNNEFRIHFVGIGDFVNKNLIIKSSKAGNGKYYFINNCKSLKKQVFEILNECTKEYINNYNFITNNQYEVQPINKITYNQESLKYCFIQKGNEENDINIKFNWENLNKKFSENLTFKSNELIKLPEGEELSKLIIDLILKYSINSKKKNIIKLSKKYQVLSKYTTLFSEIEGDKPIENKMNTFIQKYSIEISNYSNFSIEDHSVRRCRKSCYRNSSFRKCFILQSSPIVNECPNLFYSPHRYDSNLSYNKPTTKKNNYGLISVFIVIFLIFICYMINKLI